MKLTAVCTSAVVVFALSVLTHADRAEVGGSGGGVLVTGSDGHWHLVVIMQPGDLVRLQAGDRPMFVRHFHAVALHGSIAHSYEMDGHALVAEILEINEQSQAYPAKPVVVRAQHPLIFQAQRAGASFTRRTLVVFVDGSQ